MNLAGSSRPPLVSVVLPTRNRVEWLRATVASILAQTFGNLEVIVVDDASNDDTALAVGQLAAGDPRVRLLRQEVPVGAAAARNRGVSASRGDLIAFSDDDCLWVPDKIERQLAALRGGDVAVFSPAIFVGVDGREEVIGSLDPADPAFEDQFFKHGVPGPFVFLVRRDAFERVGGFDEDLPRLQDIDLWFRLYREGGFAFVPQPLLQTWWIAGGISTRTDALVAACALIDAKYPRPGDMTRWHRALMRRGFAHTLLLEGAYRPGVVFLWRSFLLAPSLRGMASLLVGIAGPGAYRAACAVLVSGDGLRS